MTPPVTGSGAAIRDFHAGAEARPITWADWWPVALGLLLLYLPTYARLATEFWNQQEHAHGIVVLATSLWLFWRSRDALSGDRSRQHAAIGGGVLLAGLLSYVLGKSQDIPFLEVASQIPVLAGAILLMRGPIALRRLWFAVFFLLFLVPLPGIIVDPLTAQLKQHVSAFTERLLYAADYPIARNGVVLTIGAYQLLVADACSGLHSLFSMGAAGLLYVYLTSERNMLRDGVLVASVPPIGFAANVVRVTVLTLVTHHFGDEAGQGFIHGLSGVTLFAVGILMLFALDTLIGAWKRKPERAR